MSDPNSFVSDIGTEVEDSPRYGCNCDSGAHCMCVISENSLELECKAALGKGDVNTEVLPLSASQHN